MCAEAKKRLENSYSSLLTNHLIQLKQLAACRFRAKISETANDLIDMKQTQRNVCVVAQET